MSIEATVALFSILFNLCFVWVNYRIYLKTSAISKDMLEIEKQRYQSEINRDKKAYLSAKLQLKERSSFKIDISNSGSCAARNIRAEVDGLPFHESRVYLRGAPFPILIGPNSHSSVMIRASLNCAPPYALKIRWEDDFGSDRTYETTLTS